MGANEVAISCQEFQICRLLCGINHGYLFGMKSTISILDRFFEAAARLVKRLGTRISASSSKTASVISAENQVPGVRAQLDAVYAPDPESSRIDPRITRLQILSLPEEDW